MKNAYDDDEARAFVARHAELPEALAQRIHTSHLLGSEPGLVLHGGGNTSVKLLQPDLLGEPREVLFVKASGHDLATLGADGFAAMDLAGLKRLRGLQALDDLEMENQLLTHRLDARSAAPSVETLLHAFLPQRFVDHTHADAVLVLTNTSDPEARVREALGPRVGVLPYVMPGLPLALQVAECVESNSDLLAIVSLHHGIFSFGDDAQTAYTRMIDCVTRAEAHIDAHGGAGFSPAPRGVPADPARAARAIQALRGACAHREPDGRTRRWVAVLRATPEALDAATSPEAETLCRSGVLTPDHAIRTRNEMLHLPRVADEDDALADDVRRAIDAFAAAYDGYFEEHATARGGALRKLDDRPRLALVAGVGLVGLGRTRREAAIAADIAEHTIRAKRLAGNLGGYVPIDTGHVFDMEYWSLQQKKLDGPPPQSLQGQVAFVTGAGGAIGAGIAERLLAAGAHVVISDVDQKRLAVAFEVLAEQHGGSRILSCACDVTDLGAIERAFEQVSHQLGGIDLLVPNAGIAHVATLEDLEPERFQRVIDVNLMGTFLVIKAAIPIFRRQGSGGNVVLISSKNVPDPGAAFGAYSASKAGAHQIAKIAALELAPLGVRVNMVNPDAVFGDERVSSGLWDLIGPDRMKSRGLDPDGLKDYYRQRNLLKISVLAEHVGNAVVFFATEQTPTTGASFPVDGGVPSAFPR